MSLSLSQLVPNLKKQGNELHGPCPFCGSGTDRFVVWPEEGRDELGRFWCRQCEEKGDAIDYVRTIDGITYAEALVKLGLPDDEYTTSTSIPLIGNGTVNGAHTMPEEETYDYTDEKGEIIFQVVRGKNKKFSQRVPTENGWNYKVKGVRKVLYRLPSLLKAIEEGKALFMVEGEKDVHTLEAMNLTATTSPAGSAAWLDEYATLLVGVREIILIPDRDKPGLKYANAIAESLGSRNIPFRVIHLDYPLQDTHGKDVTDWFKERNISYSQARAELIAMTKGAVAKVYQDDKPYPKPFTLEELLARQYKPPEWVVPGVLPFGVTLLVAKPKTGKTFFALSVAHAVATGGNALGSIPVKRGKVLYLVLEDSQRGLQKRMEHLTKLGGKAGGRMMFSTEWNKMDEDGLTHLDMFLKDHPDTRLVIIDTLKRVRPSGDYRKGIYDQDYEAIFPLTMLGDVHDCSFLVIHHANKQHEIDDPADLASGSTGLTGAAENIMVMRRTSEHEGVDLWMRGRDAEEVELALVFDPDTLSWKYEGDAREFGMSKQRQKIIEIVEESKEPLSPKDVTELGDLDYSSVRNMMTKMVHDGILMKKGYGKYVIDPTFVHDKVSPEHFSKPDDTDDSGDTPGVGTVTGANEDDDRPF